MNTSNPFQIPSCLQRADSQQRRRERFKKGFIAIVAAVAALLIGLLIEGCMSEKTEGSGAKVTALPLPHSSQPLNVQKLASNPQPGPGAAAKSAPSAAVASAATPIHSEPFYTVKSGDTLNRIARVHGTTVKALKAANSLENDRIVVGAKLRIPEV